MVNKTSFAGDAPAAMVQPLSSVPQDATCMDLNYYMKIQNRVYYNILQTVRYVEKRYEGREK